MSERFIKYLPNEKAAWLRKHHTALYLLLSLAVERARWSNKECPLGLKQGDAILGNPKQAGISPKQYVNAIQKGIELGIWEKVYSRKDPELNKGQKRTIKGTIKSLVINVKDTGIWDLNIKNMDNHKDNDRTMTGQSQDNKQEQQEHKERKEYKKKQPQTPSFVLFPFLEKIGLTPAEQAILSKEFKNNEEDLRYGVKFVTDPGFTPDILIASIRWAAREKPVHKLSKEESINRNRLKSIELMNKCSLFMKENVLFECFNSYCEIHIPASMTVCHISYDQPIGQFDKLLFDGIKKYGKEEAINLIKHG